MKSNHFLFFGTHDQDGTLRLAPSEAHHAARVLRVQPGQDLRVTDGAGSLFTCKVSRVAGEKVELEVVSRTFLARPVREVFLAVGIPDRDPFERLVEMVVPLGVAGIMPLTCRFSQGKWWRDWKKLGDRFERKLISGLKQSQQSWKPVLHPPQSLESVLETVSGSVLLADESGTTVRDVLPRLELQTPITCFVGPPGGFSDDEISSIDRHSPVRVALSPYRFRTELASVLCSWLCMS